MTRHVCGSAPTAAELATECPGCGRTLTPTRIDYEPAAAVAEALYLCRSCGLTSRSTWIDVADTEDVAE